MPIINIAYNHSPPPHKQHPRKSNKSHILCNKSMKISFIYTTVFPKHNPNEFSTPIPFDIFILRIKYFYASLFVLPLSIYYYCYSKKFSQKHIRKIKCLRKCIYILFRKVKHKINLHFMSCVPIFYIWDVIMFFCRFSFQSKTFYVFRILCVSV